MHDREIGAHKAPISLFPPMHAFQDRSGTLRSLNRARVGSLPEALVDPEIVGKNGLQLATGWALIQDLFPQAAALGLVGTGPELPHDLDRLLRDPGTAESQRLRAEEIVERFGRRLGCLLLALKLGEPATRAARPEWGDDQWVFWRDLRRIVIGGGLLSGRIGEAVLPAAQAVLDAHGAAELRLERSRFGAAVAVAGLSRCLPLPAQVRWVFDFGQTSIKRGVATYAGGRVTALTIRPAKPSVCPPIEATGADRADIERQWTAMLDVVAESVEAGPAASDAIDLGLCLATYLFDGHPDPNDVGCYGRLRVLAPNLATWMHSAFETRFGRPVRLHVFHDGTAAALSEDSDAHTLVLTIGTALGSGFPEMNVPVAPFAEGFTLSE